MVRSLFARVGSAPAGLLGMLVLVAAVESYLARDEVRFSSAEADTWRAAAHLAGHAPAGGVLLLGDSQVEQGISPRSVEARLGRPVRNLAVPGGQPTSSYILLERAIRSGAAPSAVVVDFEPHLLINDRGPGARVWPEVADLADSFELAWALRSPDDFAQMLLGSALPSYRWRPEVRGNVQAALHGEAPGGPAAIAMLRRNRKANRGAVMMSKKPPGTPLDFTFFGNQVVPWAPHPINEAYARRLLGLARAHKIPVFLALMPVTPGLRAKAAASGQEAAYLAWIARLQASDDNVSVLDFRHADYPEPAFVDAMHLNFEGATSVGSALGEHLRPVLRGERPHAARTLMPGFRLDGSEAAVEDLALSASRLQAATARR